MRHSREQLAILQNEMRACWQAGSVRLHPGRPAQQLDADMAYVLALHGMTHAQIAEYFGCDRKTLEHHCGPVLKRAAQRRALLLPRALWQRDATSTVDLKTMEAELERHCLDFEQLEIVMGQGSGENNRNREYRNSSPRKRPIRAAGNREIFAKQKNNPRINEEVIEQLLDDGARPLASFGTCRKAQPPNSDTCNLQQKIAGELRQAKALSPEFFPKARLRKAPEESLERGDHNNTLEPFAVNVNDHGVAIESNAPELAPAPKPERRPWTIVEVLW